MRSELSSNAQAYLDRTKKHADAVKKLGAEVFGDSYTDHDIDKLTASKDVLELWAERYVKGMGGLDEDSKAKINPLLGQRVKGQPHHAEYWDPEVIAEDWDEEKASSGALAKKIDASKMPDRYLREMCCDWAATSFERNSDPHNWFEKISKDRYDFTPDQVSYINKCLDMLTHKEEKVMYYRYTYGGEEGIYETLKKAMGEDKWIELLRSGKLSWLPKPPIYLDTYRSYFTELGNECFKVKVLPICRKYLDMNLLKRYKTDKLDNIIYEDDYQVIIEKKDKLSESKEENKIQKVVDFLKDCDYGIVNNGEVVSDPEEMDKVASDGKSHLLTPEEVEKYKCATCWATANYIKAKLPEVDTYYIEIHDAKGNMLTHTFCVYENDEEALWIEGSWRPYVGKVISFDTLDDLFDFVTEHLINDDKEISSEYIVEIYKYETYGEEKISDEEFMDRCKSGELVRSIDLT